MNGLRRWWFGLERRERRTLSIGGAALAGILFYFLVWQPIQERTVALEERLQERRDLLAYLERARLELGAVDNAEPAGSPGETPAQALYALADESAREAGLAQVLDGVEPSGQAGARVRFDNIAFDDLVRWLGTLRERYGVTATTVSVRRTEDPGRVDAQLLLESG